MSVASPTRTTGNGRTETPLVVFSPQEVFSHSGPHMEVLREAGFELRFPPDSRLALGQCSEDETIEQLQGASAVIAWAESYSQRVIDALPKLRVISRAGVGYDRVDVRAATERQVVVTITPNANHEAVAEHAFALLFAVAKSLVDNDRAVRSGGWPTQAIRPIRGCTLGIVGLGRIGRSMAMRAGAMRLRVLASDSHADLEFAKRYNIELVSLDELLAVSDFVSLHCPLSPATRGMFDRKMFAKMKPGSVLINTARGGLVVQPDLVDALRSGHLSGAGLDVLADEPPAADEPLLSLPNVVISPHNAGSDVGALDAMAVEAATNIAQLKRGNWPAGAVLNDSLRASWRW
jgi:phosphoglycerate dehydrogenase-like enzyme